MLSSSNLLVPVAAMLQMRMYCCQAEVMKYNRSCELATRRRSIRASNIWLINVTEHICVIVQLYTPWLHLTNVNAEWFQVHKPSSIKNAVIQQVTNFFRAGSAHSAVKNQPAAKVEAAHNQSRRFCQRLCWSSWLLFATTPVLNITFPTWSGLHRRDTEFGKVLVWRLILMLLLSWNSIEHCLIHVMRQRMITPQCSCAWCVWNHKDRDLTISVCASPRPSKAWPPAHCF